MRLRATPHAAAAAIAALYGLASWGEVDPLVDTSSATRGLIYQTWSGASVALLGFGLTAFGLFFALAPTSRLAEVVAYHGERLGALLSSALVSLAITSFGFASLIALDTGKAANGWRFAGVYLAALSAIATGQLIWLAARSFRVVAAEIRAVRRGHDEMVDINIPPPPDPTFSPPPERPLRR